MTSRRALLDVNVLLALAWPNHQFHSAAQDWFLASRSMGWCTCAITELGFVRLSCSPSFTSQPKQPFEAVEFLTKLADDPHFRFIKEMPSVIKQPLASIWRRLHGFQQTTDTYLLSVVLKNKITLATFDRKLLTLSPDPEVVTLLTA